MSDVTANIHINVDSSSAVENLKTLESQINQFQRSVGQSNSAAAASQQSLNKALIDGINNTGLFSAKMVPVTSSIESFTKALDNNKLSLGQYTKYAASQLPGMSKVFQSEFDTMERVATDRVKKIQSRYVELGNSAKSVQQAIQITPNNLAQGYSTDLAVAAQKQQIFNKLIDDGSTKLLNWGKNTQWAGRQLMVGFTLPLAAFGTLAAKTFMDLDKQARDFKRVYGDALTPPSEVAKNLEAVKGLASEYTKYGISVKDTMQVASTAAAAGMQNDKLIDNTKESLRLATIGQIDYQQALSTTITLQNAFNISNKDLGASVDFIGAVANQTVLTVDDLTNAIPRVAPVIQGLGGDVKDLAVMLVAMKEGGVSAEQGANALKSGLASLINPTKSATIEVNKYGINLNQMITDNKGNIMGLVQDFGTALSKLDDFSRQQVLEKVFGKYQFARIGALFDNINEKTGQTANAMQLLGASTQELATLSQKSLDQISGSTTAKFQASLENLKVSIAPIGEAFLKGITPIVDVVSKIADAFNNLPAPVKNAVAVIVGVVAGLGPIILMTIGLVANGFANIVKGIQLFRKVLSGIKGDSDQFKYLSTAELEAKTASDALEGSSRKLTESLLLQKGAVAGLVAEYQRYVGAAGLAANAGATRGARPPLRRATGGTVPGSGNGDTVPALLTPGETIVTKKASQKYAPVIAAMNAGTLQGFDSGLNLPNISIPDTLKVRKDSSQSIEKFFEGLKHVAGASEAAIRVLERFAAEGELVTKSKFMAAMRGEGIAPKLIEGKAAAHLTERRDSLSESGISFLAAAKGQGADGKSIVAQRILDGLEKMPDLQQFIKEYSGLTATLPAKLNRQLAVGTATVEDFSHAWSETGSRLLPSLKKFGNFSDKSSENMQALSNFEEELGKRIAERAIVENDGKVSDAILTQETRSLIGEYKIAGGAMAEVANAAQMASETIAQVSLDMSTAAGQALIKNNPDKFHSVQTESATNYYHTESGTFVARENNDGSRRPGERFGDLAKEAGTSQGQSQVEALKKAEGVKSPSTEGEYVSEMVAEGQLKGAQENISMSTEAGEIAGKAQVEGLKKATDPAKLAYKQSQSQQREELRHIDMIPQTRQRMMDDAVHQASIGGGDRRQAIKSAKLAELARTDEEVLAIIKEEDSQRIAQEHKASAERRATRAKADSEIQKNRNAEAAADERSAAVRRIAADSIASAQTGVQDYTFNARMRRRIGDAGQRISGLGSMAANNMGKLGAGMGMASMVPFMAQDENGNFMGMNANSLGMGMMGGGMALEGASMGRTALSGLAAGGTSLAPMAAAALEAAPPLLAVAAAAAVVAVGIKIWDSKLEESAKAAADFGANLGGTANALNNISAMFGQQTPAQRQAQLQLGFTPEEQQKAAGQFDQVFASEAGQKFIKELNDATGAEKFKKLSDYIKNGIAAGVMDQETGVLFAKAISSKVNDAILGSTVIADLVKNKPGTGSKAMLGLAQGREKAASGQGLDAYGQMGSAIQILQDYGNAVALANEELGKGKITYEEYSKVVNLANDAQKKYGNVLTETLKTTDAITTDRGLQIFDDQMSKILSPEQLDKMKKATERGFFETVFGADDGNRNGEVTRKAALGQAITGGMNADTAINAMQSIRDNPESNLAKQYDKFAGKNNQLGLAVFSDNADTIGKTLGMTDDLTNKFKELGVSFGEAGGNLETFESFIANLPDTVRQAMIDSLANTKNPEARAAAITGGSTIIGAYGQENAGTVFQSKAYSTAQKATEGQFTSQKDIDNLKNVQKSFMDMQSAVGTDNALKINVAVDSMQNGNKVDLAKWNQDSKTLTDDAKNIKDNLPPEISSKVNIDYSSPLSIEQWSNVASSWKKNADIFAELDKNIDVSLVAKYLTLDANGNELSPTEAANRTIALNKAWKNLSSSNKPVKLKAQIDLATAYAGNAVKDGQDPSKVASEAVNRLRKKFKDFDKLPAIKQSQLIQTEIDYQVINLENVAKISALQGKLLQLSKMPMTEGVAKAIGAITQEISSLQGQISGAAESANATEGVQYSNSDTGGGGGGGGTDPFKDFKSSIANQIAKYIDAGTTVKNLMSAKNNFMKLLYQNKGIDDKVRAAKLTPALQEYIMGLDPKDANKLLSKITSKNGKLNKTGIALQDRYVAGQIKQTVSDIGGASDTISMQRSVAGDLARRGNLNKQTAEAIVGDPKKAEQYASLMEKVKQGYKGSELALQQYTEKIKNGAIETENFGKELEALKDPAQFALDEIGKQADLIQSNMKEQTANLTAASESQFTALYGKTKDEADLIIKKNQVVIDQYQKQIDAIQEKNSLAQHEVDLLDHSKKKYQDQIDAIQKIIDGYQEQINIIQHEVDLRNHTSELINHQLDLMSRQEKNISDAYDKRIQALDQISSINQHLIDQQNQQIGLAKALSQGDIFAAAQAANDIQGSSAQYASDQMRNSLEQGKTDAVNGITNENGMTRIQLEQQLQVINDQNFQSQQQIWDLNQKIYANQQDILPLKKSISDIDASVAAYNDQIWQNNQAIYDIQINSIKPLQDQNKEWNSRLQLSAGNLEIAVKEATLNEAAQLRSLELATAHIERIKKAQESTQSLRQEWELVGNQIADVNKLLSDRTKLTALNQKDIPGAVYTPDGKLDLTATLAAFTKDYQTSIDAILQNAPSSLAQQKYTGGLVRKYAMGGHIGMDSVPAMLTPGEFVMRKDSVDKYGASMLSSMNMGSFKLPEYNFSGATQNVNGSSSPATSINAPMYNTYSVNVNASTNASADDIANVVMTKIRNIDNSNIRRMNGY